MIAILVSYAFNVTVQIKKIEYKWEQFTNTDVPYVQITWETPEKKTTFS